jgi:uncharacterized protein YndB with AHSA1/START domain
MSRGLVAKQSVMIHAPVAKVWDALTDPELIKKYMFGSTVTSDWTKGSPITFAGEWQGRRYEDKGVILRVEAPRVLEYSHFSPLSGQADRPENYHTVAIELSASDHGTVVSLSQDNNATEQARQHSEKNWGAMLANLKQILE